MKTFFTLLLVHAHPDDECSGTGGLAIKSASAGHRVILITCTNGEMGEVEHLDMRLDPDSPADRDTLGEIRTQIGRAHV